MTTGTYMRRRVTTPPAVVIPPAGQVINPFPYAGALPIGTTNYNIPADKTKVRWVSQIALTAAEAALSSYPRSTTFAAAHAASITSGGPETIVVKGGVYREELANNNYYKPLVWQNAPGEAVWMDGSFQVSGPGALGSAAQNMAVPGMTTSPWSNAGQPANIYAKTGFVTNFDNSPSNENIDPAGSQIARNPEMLLYSTVAGTYPRQMLNVPNVASLTAPGQCYYDRTAHVWYIYGNPSTWSIYAALYQMAMRIDQTTVQMTVKGIGFRRYATSPIQQGCISCNGQFSWFENCWFQDTSYEGIKQNGGTSQHQVYCTFENNGKAGSTWNQVQSGTIKWNIYRGNNFRRFATYGEAGGIKMCQCNDLDFGYNVIEDNWGHGAWFDIATERVTAYGNQARRNQDNGLYHEISNDSTFVGNLCTDNGFAGIGIGTSQNTKIYNNTLINNHFAQVYMESGNRTDSVAPQHMPVNWTLRNNVLSGHSQSTGDLQSQRDYLNLREWWLDATVFNAAGQGGGNLTGPKGLNWTSDFNAYYRKSTGTTPGLALLVNGTGADIHATNLTTLHSGTAAHTTQDANSIEATGGSADAYIDCTEIGSWLGTVQGWAGPMKNQTVIDPASTFAPIGPLLLPANKGLTISTAYRDLLAIPSATTPEMGALQV